MPEELGAVLAPETTVETTVETPVVETPVVEQPNEWQLKATEYETKYKDLESQLESYKPDYEYLQQFGGKDGVEPFFGIIDKFTAAEFKPMELAKVMHGLDRQRYSDFLWSLVDAHKEDILQDSLKDPKVKEQLLGKDPEYSAYLTWKASGAPKNDDDLMGLDPDDPAAKQLLAMRQQLRTIEDRNRETAQRQAEWQAEQERVEKVERVNTFVKKHEDWLAQQAKTLNWGDEYTDEIQDLIDVVQARFSRDPQAANEFKRAIEFVADGRDAFAKKHISVVQTKLAQIFKAAAERQDKKIKALRTYGLETRNKQEARKEIPSGGKESVSLGGEKIEGDMLTKVMARLQKGIEAGRIPDVFGK